MLSTSRRASESSSGDMSCTRLASMDDAAPIFYEVGYTACLPGPWAAMTALPRVQPTVLRCTGREITFAKLCCMTAAQNGQPKGGARRGPGDCYDTSS